MAPVLDPSSRMPTARIPIALVHAATVGSTLFFLLTFAIESGYSYGATLLLLAALIWWARRPAIALSAEDRTIMWVYAAYFLIGSLSLVWHGNSYKDLDQALRPLLAIPILIYLLHVNIKRQWLWAGLVGGAVLSVGVALWQQIVEGRARVEGFLNIIHFGNLALVYAVFCIAGLFWASTQGKRAHWWRAAFALGIICSLYSVNASGSRGSWMAMPALALLIFITFITRRRFKFALAAIFAFAVVVGTQLADPHSHVRQRVDAAVSDISLFLHADEADTSLGARFVMWEGAFSNIPKKPILGWNQDEYRIELERMVEAGEADPVALHYADNLHNQYLQAWAFQGIFGLLALLALYLLPFWFFAKRLRAADLQVRVWAFCGASLITGYFFFSMSQAILRRNNGIMFFVLALAVSWACMRHAERRRAADSGEGKIKQSGIVDKALPS